MHIVRFLILVCVLAILQACSSSSQVAINSTELLGNYSPVGSREVRRKQQMTIAGSYRIHIGYASGGESGLEASDLNKLECDSLARQFARYFAHVSKSEDPLSLSRTLDQAYQNNAQLMIYPKIAAWPNDDLNGETSCTQSTSDSVSETPPCATNPDPKSGEIVVMIGIYDVLSGTQLDAITARSQQGAASYIYKDNLKELDLLNQLIVSKLAPN